MDTEDLANKLKFSVLAASMKGLGMDPDEVDDKAEAIEAIYDRFKVDGQPLEFKCPVCKADIPDLDDCPFCGVTFTEDERTYDGARKGRRARGFRGPTGPSMLRKLIKALAIPRKQVKWRKSVVSFWFSDGMICRCFVGVYSVRIHLPFPSEQYGECGSIVIDYERPVKNMESRVYLEAEADVGPVVEVLKLTLKLKTAERPNRKVGRPPKPIKPMKDEHERKVRPGRPIQV